MLSDTLLACIRTRQTCRAFTGAPVDRAVLERCLEAARLAPSACNSQPWHFLVVDERRTVEALAGAACGGMYGLNREARTAGAWVVVLRKASKWYTRLGAWIRDTRYNLIDLGIAGEHLVLQAEQEGLGSWWMGWFDEKAVRRFLGLPRSSRIDVILALGEPADRAPRDRDRKPLNEVRSYFGRPPADSSPERGQSGGGGGMSHRS